MDAFFGNLSAFPENMRATVAFGLLSVLTPFFWLSKPKLASLGKIVTAGGWRPFSPNMFTIYGTILALLGMTIYAFGFTVAGVSLGGIGFIFDRIDGRAAVAQGGVADDKIGGWDEMNFAGKTELGSNLDPLSDKLKIFPLLIAFALCGIISPVLLGVMAVPEFVGTVSRWPFASLKPFRWLSSHLSGSRATGFGKLKYSMQAAVVTVCVFFHQGWFTEGRVFLDVLMALTTFAAFVSIGSRITRVRELETFKESLNTVDESLSHD